MTGATGRKRRPTRADVVLNEVTGKLTEYIEDIQGNTTYSSLLALLVSDVAAIRRRERRRRQRGRRWQR